MAAHAVQALTEELAKSLTRQLKKEDIEHLESSLRYSAFGNQISFKTHKDLDLWFEEARRQISEYRSINWDHQFQLRIIIWRELAKLLPKWVKYGEPKNYEDWNNAIEYELESRLGKRAKKYRYFVSFFGVAHNQVSVIDGIVESYEEVKDRQGLEAIKTLAKHQLRGVPSEVLSVISLELLEVV
jgi:hypothetical protein